MAVGKMDYTPIISFCHFCEIHGPSTVFSTQSFIESTITASSSPPPSLTTPQPSSDEEDISQRLTPNDLRHNTEGDHNPQEDQTAATGRGSTTSLNGSIYSAGSQLRSLYLELEQLKISCSGESGLVDEKDLKSCEGCSLTPRSLIIKKSNSKSFTQKQQVDNATNARQLYKGYVSHDRSLRRKYITANEPLCFRNLIKQACVRSLSCETYPEEKEGAIYFGDDIRWHNLSWLFVLKDSKARGFNRTYSIIISHPHKAHLMSSWKFYNEHVNNIIDNLKQKSAQIFKKEVATMDCKQQRWSIRQDGVSQFAYPRNMNSNLINRVARYSSQRRPSPNMQIALTSNTASSLSNIEDSSDDRSISDMDSIQGTPKNKDPNLPTSGPTSSSGISSRTNTTTSTTNKLTTINSQVSISCSIQPHRDATNTQRGNSEARSIIDMTDDELIFANLHLLFCQILKLTTERCMQSNPQYKVDRLSSFANNIINNNKTKRNSLDRKRQQIENSTTESSHKQRQQNIDSEITESTYYAQQQLECDQSDTLRSSQIVTLDRFNLGNIIWQDAKYFTSLRHLYMFLGRDKFKIIGYHTIIGSDIVIICKYRDFLNEFMECLAMLLPTERLQDVPRQETLIDSWKLNITGVVGNQLPNNILESKYQLLIDITDRSATQSSTLDTGNNMRRFISLWPRNSRWAHQSSVGGSTKTMTSANSDASKVAASNYRVTLHSKEKTPARLPQFLTNLVEIIRNVLYSDRCLERYLIASKEEWLTNAKMVWAITRNISFDGSDCDLSQIYHLFNIEDCDRKLIQYWADADMTFKMNAIKLA